jgi:hypothetical protein
MRWRLDKSDPFFADDVVERRWTIIYLILLVLATAEVATFWWVVIDLLNLPS